MPISDMDGYDKNHFSRVYEHLIKPACEKSGFTSVRADEVASSNYIVIDILSKIVETDMVICDLSGRNPNVLYELGIRQAFNLPTVLIKDIQTDKIFDIQGLRYVEYNQALRIDSVEKHISEITKSIQETEKAKGKDINSLIQLLGIKPASLPSQVEISGETSVILSAVKDLATRISSLENANFTKGKQFKTEPLSIIPQITKGSYLINGEEIKLGETVLFERGRIGDLKAVHPHGVIIKSSNGSEIEIQTDDIHFKDIQSLPV